jgi:dipeptidyl aminopeptidase/acylaminoacyl peptidase
MKQYVSPLFILFTANLFAQKQVIDHTVYNSWKKNEQQKVSADGQLISYEINPHRGDGWLYIYRVNESKLDSFPRGKEARFTPDGKAFVFKITPGYDTLRRCELNKIDKKKWPKDSLGIYWVTTDSLVKFPLLKSFQIGENHNYVSYLDDSNDDPKVQKSSKKKAKKSKKKTTTIQSDGKRLTILSTQQNKALHFRDVVEYTLSKNGQYVALIQHRKEKLDSNYLSVYRTQTGEQIPISFKGTSIKQAVFSPNEQKLAFLSSLDTLKVKNYNLELSELNTQKTRTLTDSTRKEIPVSKQVSEHFAPLFSEDNRFMFFGMLDRVKAEPKDSLLESEKVKLDIWHHQDSRLQSQQLVEVKSDQKKHHLYVWLTESDKLLQLSGDTLNVSHSKYVVGNYLLGVSNEAFLYEGQWETPVRENHYRISLLDGKAELLKSEVLYGGELSPKGRFYSFFDPIKKQYFLRDVDQGTEACMTCTVADVNWQEDNNGMPMLASPVGWVGYDPTEEYAFFQSHYDVWSYAIKTKSLTSLSERKGEQSRVRIRARKWQTDSVYVEKDNLFFEGLNERTKDLHLYGCASGSSPITITEWLHTPHKMSSRIRSKDGSTVVFRFMSLKEYPDVQFTRDAFQTSKKISVTNPQQQQFNWASVELISWKNYDKNVLEGLLYKPENFDPSKKYPLLIYYYELNSDELHNHTVPRPTASIIYPTEYASAGYFVLIPDIRYTTGHPGQSAYNCIMSATDYVLEKYPCIDSTRMGLQGQSWGGYQTAQLITMTNRYKAAMAGAPVSNMFSAYGGIRWSSGVNRQFQYERTQSRIGKTIWDAPELYIENSPLFHLPKVQTPLLIMSNDKDGAVPWYQGIELYTGLKRLGKTTWMLNYNNEEHNLMENANRMDLSIRMRQFFDHYLQGKPAPVWMTEGIPATQKGKTLGY